MRYVLYDRKKSEIKNMDNHTNINLDNCIKTKEEITFNFCTPNFLSFCPLSENKKFIDNEPIWLMPGLKHNLVWEENKKNEREKEEEKIDMIYFIHFEDLSLMIYVLIYFKT